jgi:Flp pilus assembly protein TadD
MNVPRALTWTVALCLTAACAPGADDVGREPTDSVPAAQPAEESPPPELAVQLDSGSAAFRNDDFQGALAHYTRATEVAPHSAAAWFGVYMAQAALGNEAEAARALAEAQALDPSAVGAHPEISRTPR